MEEEIIIPDDPPDYEPPPEYKDVIKTENGPKRKTVSNKSKKDNIVSVNREAEPNSSKSCQTIPEKIPESPPPNYRQVIDELSNNISDAISDKNDDERDDDATASCFDTLRPGKFVNGIGNTLRKSLHKYKSGILMKNARKLLFFPERNLVRYFSDSELLNIKFRMDVYWQKTKINRKHLFKKSFSTDDIMIL